MPGKVKVKIVAGRNLPVMDRSSDTTDAYVEIKLGNTTFKTDVCRKSLNPQWNSEWYRFEMDDAELQDEPLQIRLMDHDTYSANDAIGKVYLDLNPLLLPPAGGSTAKANLSDNCQTSSNNLSGGNTMSGWFPVYDTMHGIRGEVNVIVKVELFSDFNKFRQSSCGVQFFNSSTIPQGYHAQIVHGMVEELVVSDDPEYHWIDKIRTPRASNEARQTLFFKLSGEVQRRIGLKVLDFGGNAVVGYLQCFDLEAECGIVVRGLGTAVTLVRLQESSHIMPNQYAEDVIPASPLHHSPSEPKLSKGLLTPGSPRLRRSRSPQIKQPFGEYKPKRLRPFSRSFSDNIPECDNVSLKVLFEQEDMRGEPLSNRKKIFERLSSFPKRKFQAFRSKSSIAFSRKKPFNRSNSENVASSLIRALMDTSTLPLDRVPEIEEMSDIKSSDTESVIYPLRYDDGHLVSISSSSSDTSSSDDIDDTSDVSSASSTTREYVRVKSNVENGEKFKSSRTNSTSVDTSFTSSKNDDEVFDKGDREERENKSSETNKFISSVHIVLTSDNLDQKQFCNKVEFNESPKLAKKTLLNRQHSFDISRDKRQRSDTPPLSDMDPFMKFSLEGKDSYTETMYERKTITKPSVTRPSLDRILKSLPVSNLSFPQSVRNLPSISTGHISPNLTTVHTVENNDFDESFDVFSANIIEKNIEKDQKNDQTTPETNDTVYKCLHNPFNFETYITKTKVIMNESEINLDDFTSVLSKENLIPVSIWNTENILPCSKKTLFIEPFLVDSSNKRSVISESNKDDLVNTDVAKAEEVEENLSCDSVNVEKLKSQDVGQSIELEYHMETSMKHNENEMCQDICNVRDNKEGIENISDDVLLKEKDKNQSEGNEFNQLSQESSVDDNKGMENTHVVAESQCFEITKTKFDIDEKPVNFTGNNINEFEVIEENSLESDNVHFNKLAIQTDNIIDPDYSSNEISVDKPEIAILNFDSNTSSGIDKSSLFESNIITVETHEKSFNVDPLISPVSKSNTNLELGLNVENSQHSNPSCDAISNLPLPHHPLVKSRSASGLVEPCHSSVPPSRTVPEESAACLQPAVLKTSQSPIKMNNTPGIHRRSSDSDLSITPKGNSLTSSGDRSSMAGGSGRAFLPISSKLAMKKEPLDGMEFPFLTMNKFPTGFIGHIAGTVTSRSVKLLERVANQEEPESRDAWWTELRMEVRSHMRALSCNAVIGYSENTTICDDVCVLSVSGTAAVVNVRAVPGGPPPMSETPEPPPTLPPPKQSTNMTTSLDRPEFERNGSIMQSTPLKPDSGGGGGGGVKVRHHSESMDQPDTFTSACSICHLPFNPASVPLPMTAIKCAVCGKRRVPDLLLATIEPLDGLPTVGRSCLIHVFVTRPKQHARGEMNACVVSDSLPFIEYDIYKQLVNKLKVNGMNAVFGLKTQICLGERMIAAVTSGTAMFLEPLPIPSTPIITPGESWNQEGKLASVLKGLQETVKKNRDFYQVKTAVASAQEADNTVVSTDTAGSDTEDSEDDLPDIDIHSGNKEACVFMVDDEHDIEVVSQLIDPHPPEGFLVTATEGLPGLDELEVVRNLQMFTQIWRSRIPSSQPTSSMHKHFHKLLQGIYYKLRRMTPCAVGNIRFRLALPDTDEMQISIVGMAVGLGEGMRNTKSVRRRTVGASSKPDSVKKSDDGDMIFSLEEDQETSNNQTVKNSKPKSPLRPKRQSTHLPPKERYGVDITPLSYIPGGRIEKYLGNLNFFFIRETSCIREGGGLSGFVHSFVAEVLAILRAHVTALGGNAMVAFFLNECIILNNPHKNHGQCLINVGGDAVSVSYID